MASNFSACGICFNHHFMGHMGEDGDVVVVIVVVIIIFVIIVVVVAITGNMS